MNTIPFEGKKEIRMIAHRGLSGLERENTCAAFVAAGVRSYYGIETDVHVTKDGRFLLHHDSSVKRLTGEELLIEETDFETLRALRMKDLDGVTVREDLFLPTLDEYLSICRKYGKKAILELKERMAPESVFGIAGAVRAMGMLEETVFISFYPENLLALRRAEGSAAAQFLSMDPTEEVMAFILENGFDADLYDKKLTRELVERLHAAGRLVNVWTVDSPQEAARFADYGVDMITTNILE